MTWLKLLSLTHEVYPVLKENEMSEEKKVEYEIEDEVKEENQVEIVDDTPEEDRNKQHLGDVDVPEEEIQTYSANVQKRINQLKRAYHDERRDKERFEREQREAINYAKSLASQNKTLQEKLSKGESVLIESQTLRYLRQKKNTKMLMRQAKLIRCLRHKKNWQDLLTIKKK